MTIEQRITELEKRVAELEAKAQPQQVEIKITDEDIAKSRGRFNRLSNDDTAAKF